MNPTLFDLKDIHEPEAIGWWPPALGWWLLAIAVPLLVVLLVWLYKRMTRKTALKTANKMLVEIKQDATSDNRQKLSALSALFRRVAISVSARNEAAGLTGQQWLAFLDRSVKGMPFTEGPGKILADAPYRSTPPTDQEISELIGLCENWLKAQVIK
ncbi:MAG: DUF4381 domain-containing protein [Methylobacter sp.]